MEFLIVPAAGLACLVNHKFVPVEILWTFSIYLESVAILPQLFMISKTGEAESITSHYLFAQGMYRAFYIANWIYWSCGVFGGGQGFGQWDSWYLLPRNQNLDLPCPPLIDTTLKVFTTGLLSSQV